MNWTDAQKRTIETKDHNILVSAAAGSGKTTVLIERIKQLVLGERTDIDRFLITTFTNAAAAEMKEKMERAIQKELDALRGSGGDPERIAFLQKQLQLLPQASISTFHTFSLGIMRDFFFLTDLQPGFQIGDETQMSIMRNEALDEVFSARFDDDQENFTAFLRRYSADRHDNRLKHRLLKVHEEMRSIPNYLDWAENSISRMETEHPLRTLGISLFLLQESAESLQEAARWYDTAAQRLDRPETGSLFLKARQDTEYLEAASKQAKKAMEECAAMDTDAERQDAAYQALGRIQADLAEFSANQMRAKKDEKEAFAEVKEEITWLRQQGKSCLDRMKKNYFRYDLDMWDGILRESAADTRYFAGLIREMDQVYQEKKRAQNIVDFDDCMHYALAILEDEAAAEEYRQRFQYIFIDEYQDSNHLQEAIVARICREDNLFMVGDVKQSIYKFRLAEPEIFRRRYDEYRRGEDERSVCIDLNSNFRSRRTIRDAVNRIFERIMEGYDEDASLKGPEEEPRPGYPVSLYILGGGKDQDEEEADSIGAGQEDPAAMEEPGDKDDELTEPELIARIIRENIGKPIADRDGSIRPMEYGDIAVLSRGGSAIPGIERYLNNEGIPAFGSTEGGYYETVEIQVFLSLLKVISNPMQDVPLISAMSSVVFGFTVRELAQIRIACRRGSFASAVRSYASEGENEAIKEKISAMLAQIDLWKEIERTVPLDELMRRLLYDTGYYDYCSGLPVGKQRTSNLRLLLERAAAYEERSHLGLYGFLSYVEAMRSSSQQVSEAAVTAEDSNTVQVMTVHKSKGLEFPMVILAGAGKQITGSSEGREPAMHKEFTIGLPEVDKEQHWSRKTILQLAIAGKKTRESLEEEIRILYVALTRPMEKLAIVGTIKDASKLQSFPTKGSFLQMIYGTLCEMAEQDPETAEVILVSGRHTWDEAGAEPEPETEHEREHEPEQEPGQEADPVIGSGTQPEHAPAEELSRRLGFIYPYGDQRDIRTKYSVTALSHMAEEQEELQIRVPELRPAEDIGRAMEEGRLSAPQIGTAMHTVMEKIDFGKASEEGLPYIRSFIDSLKDEGFLTEAEHEVVNAENILAFFQTPVGKRAAAAPSLLREKEFLLQKEIEDVPAIVQGIIDCYFEDDAGIVLVDYKNSWAATDEEEEVILSRYRGQLMLYREALELALGRKVDECWLYLFRSKRLLRVDGE